MSGPGGKVREVFGRLLNGDGGAELARVVVGEDGRIEAIEAVEDSRQRAHSEEGAFLAPAFFDVHVHGAAGHDVMQGTSEAVQRIGRSLASCGVGQYLATTVTAPLDVTLRALEGLAKQIEAAEADSWAAEAAAPVGIHLEGPFLSHAKRGVHPQGELREPSIALFERFREAAHGRITLLTVAPELPGALELIRHATGLGVRVSMGHSDALGSEARAGIVAGASSATHTFNAMRRLEQREPGIAGIVLDSEDVYAEIIADGIHVAPEMVRLWWKAKGPDRALLVTDGISATGVPEGEYDLGGLRVTVAGGRCLLTEDLSRGVETLAGSVLTMNRAVKNLIRFTGCSVECAVGAATRNPARMTGMERLESVRVGGPANLVRLSRAGELTGTMLGGRWVS